MPDPNRKNIISLAGKTAQEKNQIIKNLTFKNFFEKRLKILQEKTFKFDKIPFLKCPHCGNDMNNFSDKIGLLIYIAYVIFQDMNPGGRELKFYITGDKSCYINDYCRSCDGEEIKNFIKENYDSKIIDYNLIKDLIE